MRALWVRHVAVAAVVALCVTTFSGAAWATSTDNGGSSPAHLTASSSPILIGDLCDCTGAYASSSNGWAPGAEVWMKWVNAHGGISGHPVKLFEEDTRSNESNAIPDAKQLIDNDHVVAIFVGNAFSTDIASLMQADGIPAVGGTSLQPTFSTNPDFFPASSGFSAQLLGIVDAGLKVGHKKIGAFTVPGGSTGFTQLLTPLVKQVGATFLLAEEISDSAPNYDAQCLAMQSAGVNDVLVLLDSLTAIRAAQDCASQGYHPLYVADTTTISKAMLKVPSLDGLLFTESNAPYFAKSPALSQFDGAMEKYNPSFYHSAQFSEGTLQAWVSGLLLQAAIQAAKPKGAVTAAVITKGLYKLHHVTLGGLAPPLSYKPNVGHDINCYFVGELHHGAFTAPFGANVTCPPS